MLLTAHSNSESQLWCSHSIDEKTEAQDGYLMCMRPPSEANGTRPGHLAWQSWFCGSAVSVPLEGVGDSRSSKNMKVIGSESHLGRLPLGWPLFILTGPVCDEHLPTSFVLHPIVWRERAPGLGPPPGKCITATKSFVLHSLYFFCKVTFMDLALDLSYIIMANHFLVRVRK